MQRDMYNHLLWYCLHRDTDLPSDRCTIASSSCSVRWCDCALSRFMTICRLATPSGSGMYNRLTKRRLAASSISCGLNTPRDSYQHVYHNVCLAQNFLTSNHVNSSNFARHSRLATTRNGHEYEQRAKSVNFSKNANFHTANINAHE